jgi:hypothetical protein
MNTKAKAIGGPLDGQEVVCNGETIHVPVAQIGKPAKMFIYRLQELQHSDGRSDHFLIPLDSFWNRGE